MNEVDILITEEEIRARVAELGEQISADYNDSALLLVVGILRGSFIFMADLVRQIKRADLRIDFLAASSYGSASVSSGAVRIEKDIVEPVRDRDVLIVEDIIDTGLTLSSVVDMFTRRGARSVKVCCLLDKPDRRQVPVPVDYCGFTIPDEFVVGYGLDYDNRYRAYPAVCVLKPEVYNNPGTLKKEEK